MKQVYFIILLKLKCENKNFKTTVLIIGHLHNIPQLKFAIKYKI